MELKEKIIRAITRNINVYYDDNDHPTVEGEVEAAEAILQIMAENLNEVFELPISK